MTEVDASVAIWRIRAEEMALTPNEKAPQLLRLNICEDVRIVLDRDAPDTAEQAVAMRRLAGLATEAAEELERRAARKAEGEAVRRCSGCPEPATCSEFGRCPLDAPGAGITAPQQAEPAACPDHRPVLDSAVGWYCPACGSDAPPDGSETPGGAR